MHPLRLVVAGVLLVFLDVEVNDVDLLPDLLGAGLAALALLRVRRHSRWLDLALVGALAMLPESVLGLTGGTAPAPVWLLTTLGQTALVFGTCSALVTGARSAGLRRSARRLRWIDLALVTPLLALFVLGPDEPTHVDGGRWTPLLVLAFVVVLAVAAWWLVLLWRTTDTDLSPERASTELSA